MRSKVSCSLPLKRVLLSRTHHVAAYIDAVTVVSDTAQRLLHPMLSPDARPILALLPWNNTRARKEFLCIRTVSLCNSWPFLERMRLRSPYIWIEALPRCCNIALSDFLLLYDPALSTRLLEVLKESSD